MSRPLSAAMHKQSGLLIGHCDVAATASQSLGLISMLCLETGMCEHINKCFFGEDSLWVWAEDRGGNQILSSLLWEVAEKVMTRRFGEG